MLRDDLDEPDPVDEIVDCELTVEQEDRAILDTVPGGFPLAPRLQSHIKHDRPGIVYRQALGAHVGHPGS